VRKPNRYPHSLRGFVVCRRAMMLALHSEHPLARHDRIHPSQLRSETSIIYRSDESGPAALAFIKFMRQHAISEKQGSD
jgi:hypothetical protein